MTKGATRMELRRLKARLVTAKRGHKMLKDKSDEMVRRLVLLSRRAKSLRERVRAGLPAALSAFVLAKSSCGEAEFLESILMPGRPLWVDCTNASLLSVQVPKISLIGAEGESISYAYSSMPAEADVGVRLLAELLPVLLELAETEQTYRLLEAGMKRTKRRVNALEYVMIPEAERDVRAIVMKLEENERAATVRLMKLKGKLQ